MGLFAEVLKEARKARALYGSAPTELRKHFDGRLEAMTLTNVQTLCKAARVICWAAAIVLSIGKYPQ